jgi:hypothetical protein
MLVSNFNLGYNPTFGDADEPRWTRTYSLQVTNLSGDQIQFEIEYRATNMYFGGTSSSDPVLGSFKEFTNRDWQHDFRGYYCLDGQLLAPNTSEIFHLGPAIFFQRDWTPYVQGYSILRVPVVRALQSPNDPVPQSTTAIPVLLNAWHEDDRIQTVDNHDQWSVSQCDVPLSSGKAYNEITPETHPIYHPSFEITTVKETAGVRIAMKDFRFRRNRQV